MVTTLSDLEIGHTLPPSTTPSIDRNAAELAVGQLLTALGIDASTEVGVNTPRRVADAYAQMLTQKPWEFTKFPNEDDQHDLVVTGGIEFTSVCGHHLLPFFGTAAVGYRPAEFIPGLSKVARSVRMFAARLQTQEGLGQQVARFLQQQLECADVGVLLRAEHTCMTCRGVRAQGSLTITVATTGALQTDATARAEFLQLASMAGRAA
ncbi:GTP cyclohydrolase I [Micromonospora sp. Llam7]|uniref:GTP cyclohydrolase I n=1 Tax=Micromonospora tarapacensis TaxID=2835305 RepID=UPI001C83B845|nr:GTP cyclohydrolase I [Micromonospora tarapacensis]